jgi:sarcosine oxidase subunit alpha
MAEEIHLRINGREVIVASGTSVAAAIAGAGEASRYSIGGQPRAPLCGMGICFECRCVINGEAHAKACQILCANGMEVVTDA